MTAFEDVQPVLDAVVDLTTPELAAELAAIEARLHILRSLTDALSRLEEVNQVVQFSANRQDALEALTDDPFHYSPAQAAAVLGLPLSCQSVDEIAKVSSEMDQLLARRTSLREQVAEVSALHWFG